VIVIGIAERKEREKAEMREEILKAAREIICREGLEKVSIRKIAYKIEYSPAIIYHYFDNKEEIIEKLIAENYAQIMKSLSPLQSADMSPAEKLRVSTLKFITMAVEMGDSYTSMMLNSSPTVLSHTSVLQNGAAAERPAIGMLCKALREHPALAESNDAEIEIIAQIIWSTAFGLALRLIVEHVDEQQKNRLINHAVEFILHALENEQSDKKMRRQSV